MGMSDEPFEVMCPECGGLLKIDPVTRAIIAHQAAKPKKTFEDFTEAKQALKEADARRESIFAQSVEAQKNAEDVLAAKFAEAFKKGRRKVLSTSVRSASLTID